MNDPSLPPAPDPLPPPTGDATPQWPSLGYWVRVAIAVIAIVVGLRVVLLLQGVLLVVVASLVLALGMQPAVAWLERRGLSRAIGLAVLLVGIGAVMLGGLVVVVPVAVGELDGFVDSLPQIQEEIRELGGLGPILANRLDPSVLMGEGGEEVTRTIGTVASTVFNVLTVLVLTPYFAYAFPRMKMWLLRLLYREDRPDLLRLLNEAGARISGYILGNLVVSALAGIVSFLGFWLMGIEFAIVLALWIAFTDLIPVLGAVIGAVPALAVAGRDGLGPVVAVALFLLAYQLFENYVVSPRVMTRAIDLSPAAVIVALMIGGTLAGVTGALLALPLAAMVKLAMEQYVISSRLEKVRAGSDKPRRPGNGRSRPLP